MNVRTLVLLLLIVLLVLFVALNWTTFTTQDELSLVFGRVQAPLGLVMLGVVALFTLVYVLFSVSVRTSTLMESRRYSREVEAARKLADEVEESRFNALKEMLEAEMEALRATVAEEAAGTRAQLEESQNVLTAHLAQIDDFMKGVPGEVKAEAGTEEEEEGAEAAPSI